MLSPNQAREGPPIRVQRTRAKRMFAASEPPSANTPSRDILFPLLISGRKPAEWGHSGQIVRTMRTGSSVHFGPFFVSLGPVSPKQPNHGHFGTDVGSLIIQRVGGRSKGVGFEKPRSGGVNRDRTLRFGCRPSVWLPCSSISITPRGAASGAATASSASAGGRSAGGSRPRRTLAAGRSGGACAERLSGLVNRFTRAIR